MSQNLERRIVELRQRLVEINDLRSAGAVLRWDQATHMPAGGAPVRARQVATLSRLAHLKATDAELGRLLDQLQPHVGNLPPTEAALIRVARREFERAKKVPADFMARASACHATAYAAWARARAENDFAAVVDHLRANVELTREYAGFLGPFENVADPLIDDADEGMTTVRVRALFSEIRPAIIALTEAITERPQHDASCLARPIGERDQFAFALHVAKNVGYDLARGRLDKTLHPFCTRLSGGDVRITARVNENDITDAFFSALHETGHALYEQGVAGDLDGTPLGRGASSGVHESQARLWENIVGRSLAFWVHWYPQLQHRFPDQFGDVSHDAFYGAINRVERSLIRTDSDEVTYNLHVMMRFDLEIDMLEGRLDVRDLPDAWRERMRADVGVAPEDDRHGCLQDVHWYSGFMAGRFQGYTIGNVLAAQLYAAACQHHPDIPAAIERGETAPLLDWLRREIYVHGRRLPPDELIGRATGHELQAGPYLTYLRKKFSDLYGLQLPE